MTREQLDAIRARARSIEANKPRNDVWLFVRQDVPALLAEVEGMRESCTGLVKQNERQYDEVLRLTTEVERLTAERDAFMALDASYREQINEAALRTNQAFQRGVAAMREAAASHFSVVAPYDYIAPRIRALPDPEDSE